MKIIPGNWHQNKKQKTKTTSNKNKDKTPKIQNNKIIKAKWWDFHIIQNYERL